jgi:hypothetical protein
LLDKCRHEQESGGYFGHNCRDMEWLSLFVRYQRPVELGIGKPPAGRMVFLSGQYFYNFLIIHPRKVNDDFFAMCAKPAAAGWLHGIPGLMAWIGDIDG